jgi:hypothetical protein
MNAARILTTVLICLGLGIPNAHGIALCVSGDGSLRLESAVNGACAGSQALHSGEERAQAGETGLRASAPDHCAGCRDVVLGSRTGPLLPTDSKPRRLVRSGDDASSVAEEAPFTRCILRDSFVLETPTSDRSRPVPRSTEVLRL